MDQYYVNDDAQTKGEHEVHRESCSYLPKNKTYVGTFSNCKEAIAKAKTIYTNVDGCYFCIPDCHTR
ncbi:MAG TPA: hypothetical protein DIW44_00180 [Anaerolineaceae bacterium]|nr:hypothetical protein [Anaerolineaceae bacterium]